MSVTLNHTIVHARDKRVSAAFLVDILGLGPPSTYGPFVVVQVANGVSLDYVDAQGAPQPQHYAFLVAEDEFDAIHQRITARGLVLLPQCVPLERMPTRRGGWRPPASNSSPGGTARV